MARVEFDGRAFHAGTILGLRSFRISGDKLLGPVYPEHFKPGENLAICKKNGHYNRAAAKSSIGVIISSIKFDGIKVEGSSVERTKVPDAAALGMERMLQHLTQYMTGDALVSAAQSLGIQLTYATNPPPPPPPEPEQTGHQVAGMDCTCGFYAYFDEGDNAHHTATTVLGIIEGYGVVTMGTRGFRSEKARLLCLIGPRGEESVPVAGDGVQTRYVKPVTPAIEAAYNVPVYPDVKTATAEYPLVAPESEEVIDA